MLVRIPPRTPLWVKYKSNLNILEFTAYFNLIKFLDYNEKFSTL